MRRRLPLAFVLLLIAAPAFADGTVMRAKGCGDKIFVATEGGYSVLVASQSDAANDGDRLIGDTDKIGFGTFYLPDSGRHFSASVDARGLSKSEVTTRIATSCHALGAERLTSGQVERAAGCGNKIFVNTNEGYAVLERLAGGNVYAGDTLVGNFSRAGRATVKDRQTNAELVVFVHDFGLSKSAAQRKIAESCR
ncbi:MAG TPA: hypothetical protein VFQ90_02560 [Stellaceae bacterium]|nr:hypothetical protein [Stellaceae bacterium]